MGNERNHLLAPRSVLNTKQLFSVFMLKELCKNNFYGKEIYDKLCEYFIGYGVPVSYSTIYNSLHDLEEKGYIVSWWDTNTALNNRTKRYYKITDEGIKYYNIVSIDIIGTLKKNKNLVHRYIELLE